MTALAGPRIAAAQATRAAYRRRIAFLGASVWIDGCAPPATDELMRVRWPLGDRPEACACALAAIADFRPHVTVIFDPAALPAEALRELPGITLGVLTGGLPAAQDEHGLGHLVRVISFRPALSGARAAGIHVWRSIPPPVSDALFGEVRPVRGRPMAMTVGRSTPHREAMLMPAKHHHDLLQVIHGVSGETLMELLRDYDVGVYVAPAPGGGFGAQVAMHLAAGQLLFSETLLPAHGLERNIDYLHFDSPQELVWMLDRLRRFPEMHQRIRVRGHLKAEQYRASKVFRRVVHDLLADLAVFG